MRPNIEHKFNSPNEELEWLRSRYKEESAEAKKGEKMIEEQELAAKVLYEHIQKTRIKRWEIIISYRQGTRKFGGQNFKPRSGISRQKD